MPVLDRVIQLHLRAEGTRNQHGEFVPGEFGDPITVWAIVSSGGLTEISTDGASITIGRRAVFDVRYRQDVIDAGPARLEVTDYRGDRFNVETITDYRDRRRAMRITGVTFDGHPTP